MKKSTMTSRQFNQDTAGAKKAARRGPVFITDRGCPKHVLLTIEQYRRLTGESSSIIELLAALGAAEVDFDPPRLEGSFARPADLD